MSITTVPTPLEAWTILRAQSLGHIAAVNAADYFDAEVLDQYKEKFEMAIMYIMHNASEELQAILDGTQFASNEPLDFDIHLVRNFLDLIEGSDFEQLHLTAFLRVNNAELLWERVKPV